MKKITLLVSKAEEDKFISRLRKAGVLHVKEIAGPVAHDVGFIEDKIARINRLVSVLKPYAKECRRGVPDSANEKEVLDTCARVEEAERDIRDLEERCFALEEELKWFDMWGDFDPEDIEALKKKNVFFRLYKINDGRFRKLEKVPGMHVLKKDKGQVYLALVSDDPEKKLELEEALPPGKKPSDIAREIEKNKEHISGMKGIFCSKAREMDSIERCREKLEKEKKGLETKFSMRTEGKFAYIQGFCPDKIKDKLVKMAESHGIGYVIDEPDDPDNTPTLVTNPKWVKIIDPVFNFMNTLPGYGEFDISFWFLMFFSLFFAMLIGDGGYGLIFLAVTFLLRRKFKKLPGEPFILMYVLSVGTIIWGAVTGTWFGVEKVAALPGFRSVIIPQISSFGENNQSFLIFICFLIGAVQLTVARLLRAARFINSPKALAEVGWIFILWGMFFAAGKFVLGNPFPQFIMWFFATGIFLVLFFSNPEKGIFKGAAATMTDLPLSVIGSFSDIVSYLRLFAVGYASVVMAQSFNNMAVGGGINSILGGLAAAFILFIGHLLNIVLGFMAVIVHGIRLNMLEFSGHLGMQWSGHKYEPFK